MAFRRYARLLLLAGCLLVLSAAQGESQSRGAAAQPAAQGEWLSLCGKCASPKVTAKMGVGTASARAEARMGKAEVVTPDGPCPNGEAACVKQETSKIYRASADCTVGRITTILEETYTLAGLWDNSDIGGGRTQWRGADGKIVGRDNASNGLAISQQWEVLCPAPVTPALVARAANPGAAPAGQARAATPATPATPAPAQGRPATPATPATPAGSLCAGQRFCEEVPSFVATVTDFRPSVYNQNTRVVSVTLRIQNKTNRPLILGYVSQSAVAIDEQGNRYIVRAANNVRGIGELSQQFDPKFNVPPGQFADTRFEMSWTWNGRDVIGQKSWDMDISLREVNEVAAGQYRFGAEHALQFKGLAPTVMTGSTPAPASGPLATTPVAPAPPAPPAVVGAPAQAPAAAAPPAPQGDGCAGKQRCFDAGTFIAEIINTTSSFVNRSGRWHVVAMNIRFTNRTTQPISLGYVVNSAVLIDNFGNRYIPSGNGEDLKGMGRVDAAKADPQFVLQPNQSRAATFSQARVTQPNTPIGVGYALDLTIAHLEVLYNGQQVRTVREHTMTYPDFTLSGPTGAGATGSTATPSTDSLKGTADAIRGIFGGKK